MDLIDRYVFVVTEHLPENLREDVSKELRANIEDMLPDNASETEIRSVLEKMGNPVKLAAEYSPQKRYLIGPDVYDSYLSVLKLVITIASSVFGCIAFLDAFLGLSNSATFEMSGDFIANVIGAVIEGAMQAAIWVTLIFVILERSGINEGKLPFVKKKWSTDDLLDIEISNKRKISRGETIFTMVCTVLFAAMLYVKPQIFGWYAKGENGRIIISEPFFNIERLQTYIPVIIIFSIILMCILVWKFITKEWILPLSITNLFYNISVCILVGVIISDTAIVNQDFLLKLADLFNISIASLTEVWRKSSLVFFSFFVLFSVWDSVSPFVKLRR